MKLTIYPKIETVRSILAERIGETEFLFAKADAELQKITGTGLYTGTAATKAQQDARAHSGVIKTYREQLALLDSAGGETVCVEIGL